MSNDNFIWDKYSDQPYPISNKKYKNIMRRKNLFDYFYIFFTSLLIFPIAFILSYITRSKDKKESIKQDLSTFFGLCVNLDKGYKQFELIKELNCKNIQIRVPLNDIKNLQDYINFSKEFKNIDPNINILINILQDRINIENKTLLEKNINLIFSSFKDISNNFQIGNAINRTKWGFFSVDEYLKFYKTIQNIRDEKFKNILLIGPSVIDFEYHFTIRALFNNYKISYDKLSSLLYVDRRGDPQNKQMIFFDLFKKIDFLYSILNLSSQKTSDIIITETNWPISNTAPYAPTSPKECVSIEKYTSYMLRYYFLCIVSNKIQTVYWHQLIAHGYGLVSSKIDNINNLEKRESFFAFKFMINSIQNSQFVEFIFQKDIYRLSFRTLSNKSYKNFPKFDIVWSLNIVDYSISSDCIIYDRFGKIIKIKDLLKIDENPIYIYYK